MCGCMLMHAVLGHDEHRPSSQAMLAVTPIANRQKCVQCGFALQQDLSFCPNCGTSMKKANCPACGQNIDPAWNTCAHCGSPLGNGLARPANA